MNLDGKVHKATAKKLKKQEAFLEAFAKSPTIEYAAEQAGIGVDVFDKWRRRDPVFMQVYNELSLTKKAQIVRQRQAGKSQYGLVFDDTKDVPDKGTFTEWRRKYIGRPVSPHQEELVEAYEDRSNLVIFSLLPPGAGKDTTAGDFLLYEVCDDRDHRSAWVMRGESFARRRVAERIDPYLTDERTYRNAPPGPDCTIPEASLISDYGPFKFKKGMIDGAGEKCEPTTWTKQEIYFLKTGAPEADPNLWATGMEGQMYGSRIDTLIMSDVFDRENQLTVTKRESQYAWVMGTALSRLDESGRLIILGTRCLPGDNYERLINSMVGEAAVVYQGRHYTKYANGVAVVIMPAIEFDDEGEEMSYWPERFPMNSQYELPDGSRVNAAAADEVALADEYGGRVKRIRGLREIRERDRDLFDTMYQQKPPDQVTGDFTDATLNAADDESRTIGVYRPNELIVIGADPARAAGAAWVAWGVDRDKGTVTLIDFFYGEKLGIGGLKSKLVIQPISLYDPVWYCYETNREAAVVDDPEIQRVFTDFSVNLHRHHTHTGNRGSTSIGVPSLSFYMRSRVIRWPAMTANDRDRMMLVKDHFKTWDRKEALNLSRAALKGHPDDIAMAAWVGFVKAVQLLERRSGGRAKQAMPVPRAVMDKWDRMQQRYQEKKYIDQRERGAAPSMRDLISLVIGNGDDG